MKITKIEKKSGTRYTLDVDGGYYYIFDIEVLQNHGIREGMEVDEAFLEELKEDAGRRKARERAFYLLSYRDHSERELYDKLCRNYPQEIAAETVAKMVELQLLDDESYAAKLVSCYMEQKLWSYRKSLFEMKRKGISGEMAEQALADCRITPEEQLAELIERKYYRSLGDDKGNQRAVNAMVRLGYHYGEVRAAVADYLEENDIED